MAQILKLICENWKWWWRNWLSYSQRADPQEMGFLESVFSYIFGDGNPNQQIEQKRLKLASQYIRSRNGAVTAEELAPFCDNVPLPSLDAKDSDSAYVNEVRMLECWIHSSSAADLDSDNHSPFIGTGICLAHCHCLGRRAKSHQWRRHCLRISGAATHRIIYSTTRTIGYKLHSSQKGRTWSRSESKRN